MPVQVLKSLSTCNLHILKHPSTVAFVDSDSSNDSNDAISPGDSSVTTTSPPSSQTNSPRIVIQRSEHEPQHPEEEVDGWDPIASHLVLPTLVASIDAQQLAVSENLSEPPLPDRCHQIAQLLVSPTHPITHIQSVSLGEYSTVLSLGAEYKAYQPHARFFYSVEKEELTIMTPYDIHEAISKYFQSIIHANLLHMGIAEDDVCSIEFDLNGRIECGNVCHVPDLMITVNNVSGVLSDEDCVFPVCLLETAFSQDRARVLEKAIAMTDANPSVKFFLLVNIEDDTNKSSQPQRVIITTEPLLSEKKFRSLCSDCPPLGPIIVKGVQWMNIVSITFEAYLRNERGVFDFKSQDKTCTASGTLHPQIAMQDIEQLTAIGITRVIDAVIQVRLDAGMSSTHPSIEKLRVLDPQSSWSCDWNTFLRKLGVRTVRSAYQRYLDWHRKRKSSGEVDGGRGVLKRLKKDCVSSVNVIDAPSAGSSRDLGQEPAHSIRPSSVQGQRKTPHKRGRPKTKKRRS